jgi:hypothetical protein
MTFESYFDIIVGSARMSGYDAFLPSLCSHEGDNIIMKVLEGEASDDGDEPRAKEWAANFVKDGRTVFLAYRRGQRTVTVQEFLGSESIRTKQFVLDPYVP